MPPPRLNGRCDKLKQRFYLIVCVLIVLLFIGIAWGASQTAPAKATKDKDTVTISIVGDICIQQVSITNLKTGKTATFSQMDLPNQVNCTAGDTIQVLVSVKDGYRWNHWEFYPLGISDNSNPSVFKTDATNYFGNVVHKGDIMLVPHFEMLPPTPTPAPIVTSTPTPTVSPFIEVT